MGVVGDLSESELRAEIRRFERLAADLSYRRRVLQGRLDILLAHRGVLPERASLAELARVLAPSGRREPPTCLGTAGDELDRLWSEERALSRRRRVAYAIVDALRAERVWRLRRASFG